MKKEEILANCIEEIRSGKSTIEDCLAHYPKLAKELRSLLQIAARLKPDEVTPSPEFKQHAKMRLFEETLPSPTKVSHPWWHWHELTPARVLASVLIGVLILGAAGGSTVYAAQSSLPGDTLYSVKMGVENLQLAVTPGTAAKANLHLKLAQRRINEVKQQVKLNRDVNTQALETVKQQFDNALKELSKSGNTKATDDTLSRLSAVSLDQQLELEQTVSNAPETSKPALNQALEVTRRGNLVAQVAYANHDLLKRQPSVSDKNLDAGQFKIEGTLLSIQDKTWNVGGTIIRNVHLSGKTPAIGSRVKLEGLVKDNNTYISRIDVSANTSEPTKAEGKFGGTNQNGTANISGIPIKISDDSVTQLKPGDNVKLQGGVDDNKFNVTSKESNKNNSTNLSSVLTAVDTTKGTITVKMTGNLVTINVSKARIEDKNDNRRTFELSDLKRLIGQDIKLEGLSKKDNLLYASRVQIEAGK